MILYHAGPSWVHVAEAALARTELAKRLCDQHGFTQCMLYEPFGRDRGAVIAKREHMLVMAIATDGGNTWFSVAPSKEMQDLIWSFSNGFAGQWSALELKAIAGLDDWKALLEMAASQFSAAVRSVERAIAGQPEEDMPEAPELPVFEGEAMEVPADYLHSFTGAEVAECAHSS
ncbi:conserved protein of unknown function (plasmid) [Cupriavidus taiwanensis]|uniref:Uncharacterized protein n=1 Tax=Cupriavidus taiwanensis TaxID=164546 RepID=A0A375IWG1_9BURK|nr:hypothetical protein [Cupriavidus taiwanensis]SPK77495.1 conserved protein of unknown function [Cupriavidus taiwanensis]